MGSIKATGEWTRTPGRAPLERSPPPKPRCAPHKEMNEDLRWDGLCGRHKGFGFGAKWMLILGVCSCGHACTDAVCRMRGSTCVEALETMRGEESENELDWLLSMGLMWATDLKTGLKG